MRQHHVDPHSPTYFSVCSGIGGLDLAVERVTGARSVGYCERDAYAQAVLMARMEDEAMGSAPVWDDLYAVPGGRFRGLVDFLIGGIPCQPHSLAGKQLREEDERDLVDGFIQLAREMAPRFVFVENVAGFVTRHGIGRLLGGLAEIGFDAEWTSLRASDVGAPHRRERVFVLAYKEVPASRVQPDVADSHNASQRASAWTICDERDNAGWRSQTMADASGEHVQGRAVGSGQVKHRGDRGNVAHLLRRKPSAWPPGPTGDWRDVPEHVHPALAKSDVRRVADGLPSLLELAMTNRADRLRCLGNAVVPQQAEHALRTLLQRTH